MSGSGGSDALVTGGTGFIGQFLVRKLVRERVRPRVLVRPNSPNVRRLDGMDAEHFAGDLADAAALSRACAGIKTIFHVGGVKHVDPETVRFYNIDATDLLIRAAVANDVKRIVFVSDTELYDLLAVGNRTRISEDAPLRRHFDNGDAYGGSKLENERQLFEAQRQHGLGVTIVRPGMVVGPLGQILFPHLGYYLRDRFFLIVGNGDQLLPLVSVENLADALYLASIKEEAVGEAYNVVDDLEVTIRDYVRLFLETTGSKARMTTIPYFLPYTAVAAYELAADAGLLKKGKTSREQFRWKQAPMLFDNEKAKSRLGWRPRKPLREALVESFHWYAETQTARNP